MERAVTAFVAGLGCAVTRGGFTFFRDPHWSAAETAAAEALMAVADVTPTPPDGWLCLRTGGSGGGMKFARHDEQTLAAAVDGFCRHFQLTRVNAVGILPPWHVSGFMARLRCVATGGRYIDWDWKRLEAGSRPALPAGEPWVLSLVPTQLHRLLSSADAVRWLQAFRVIFLGGGPTWAELAAAAAAAGLPISLSYGMTETAAMVTAQLPGEFLAGDRSAGHPLPHASVRLNDEGRVVIRGASLCRGFFPDPAITGELVTHDLGRIDASGRLHVLGRCDDLIITGGKKVDPAAVEAALRGSGEFTDVVVIGVPDVEWGERVIACHAPGGRAPDLDRAMAGLADHQRPKQFLAVAPWPRNTQGKINRAELLARVNAAVNPR